MRKQLHIIFRLVMFCCILLFVSQEVKFGFQGILML